MIEELKNVSMSEARNELTSMPELVEKQPGAVAITDAVNLSVLLCPGIFMNRSLKHWMCWEIRK